MKTKLCIALFKCVVLAYTLTASGQTLKRTDTIWARSTAGETITLDGKLTEKAWAKAESIRVQYGKDAGIPGSGWTRETGIDPPTDPTDATLKFLVAGNQLYMAAAVKDSSIGGGLFNRFDGFLMNIRRHELANRPAPPFEFFYAWVTESWADPNTGLVGAQPAFLGFAGGPRDANNSQIWDASITVQGLTNADSILDQGYITEFRFNLTARGYDVTRQQGDVVEFNISIYDADWQWPLQPQKFSGNRVWWQGPWGNANLYDIVRIYARPDITINSGAIPEIPAEVIIPNGVNYANPVIDGQLTEPVWQVAPRFDIRYGDEALRATYPGVGPFRSGQFQPEIDGKRAAILDPGDATVKYFFKDNMIYFGFDVRDQYVIANSNFDGHDGVLVTVNDRFPPDEFYHNLVTRELLARVGTGGAINLERYLPFLVDSLKGAQVALKLKAGTTIDDPNNVDSGFDIEMSIDLTKLGYTSGLGDRVLFLGVLLLDGDSFVNPANDYSERTWWFRELQPNAAPAWAYLDPATILSAAPAVLYNVATNVSTTSVTLNGVVNPNGLSTTFKFQYGLTTSYGSEVTATPSPVTGTNPITVSAAIAGLSSNTVYHYRAMATNNAGTAFGANQTFTTTSVSNQAPSAPTLVSPSGNAFTTDNTPALNFNVPADANGDALHFRVEIDDDGNFGPGTQTFESRNSTTGFSPTPPVAQGTGRVTYTVQSALLDGDWWWRISAWDGQVYGNPSVAQKFIVDLTKPFTSNHNPAKGATAVPTNNNVVVRIQDATSGVNRSSLGMKVNGNIVTPVITGAAAEYTLTYDPPVDFTSLQTVSVAIDAADSAGNVMTTDSYSFTTVVTSPVAPAAPTLASPAANVFRTENTPLLTFNVPEDLNNDPLHFKVEIDDDGIFGSGTQTYESKTSAAGFNPPPPVAQGNGQVTFAVRSPLIDSDWWWRVSAWDGRTYGEVSSARKFTVDRLPPQITHFRVTTAAAGQSLEIPATITDLVGIQSALIYYRIGGTLPFTSTAMTNISGAAYEGIIPENAMTVRGVEYYLAVTDSTGNISNFPFINYLTKPQVIQISNPNLAFPSSTPAKVYRMISIPFDLNDKSVESVLGDDFIGGSYDQIQWRLLRFVNGINVEFGSSGFANLDFKPGMGFWLITKEARVLDAGAGRSVSTAQNYTITLPPGWSQIGNPFAFMVNWNEVRKNGQMDSRLVGYQGSQNDQSGYDYTRTQLAPFEGYFVKNLENNSITIEIPPKAATGSNLSKGLANELTQKNLKSNEWALQITAACDRYLDKDNYVGYLNNAADEWDANDFSEAPFLDQHVALYFQHPEWEKYPDLYTGDFHAMKNEGDYWDFLVKSEVAKPEAARSEVVLKLADVQNLPAEWEIILLDKTSRVAIDFGEKKQYTFPSGNGKTLREFRIVTGRKDFVETNDLNLSGVPQAFTLGQNYPNPFLSGGNPETRINYELPFTNHVKIAVYNLNGQLVRTLFDDEQSAGRYVISWDGKNTDGNRITSGLYLVRMEAGRYAAVRKAVIVK